MIQYLDTALLVAFLTGEARTADVRAWLGAQNSKQMAIGEFVITEFSAALSIKLRTGQITLSERTDSLTRFKDMVSRSLWVIPVVSDHFTAAARFADQHELALRAGDALHLAIADSQNATLCTLDKRLAAAGPKLGVSTRLI